MKMEVDSDCSDSDGHEYDNNNQGAIVIPITKFAFLAWNM